MLSIWSDGIANMDLGDLWTEMAEQTRQSADYLKDNFASGDDHESATENHGDDDEEGGAALSGILCQMNVPQENMTR